MKKRLWNKKTKLLIVQSNDVNIATYTPIFITPIPKSQWGKEKKVKVDYGRGMR